MDKVIPTNGTSGKDVQYTNKVRKIYIDGVDVSGCEHYRAEIETKMPYGEYEIQKDKCHYSGIEIIQDCKGIKGCIYKQLKRLQAENDNLKDDIDKQQLYVDSLEQESERLKKEVETWNYQADKRAELSNIWFNTAETYKQALQEIRDIVSEPCIVDENCQTCNSGCMQKDILAKINEVIGVE